MKSRYVPVSEATPEDLAARRARTERWKANRLARGLPAWPASKPRTDAQRKRAAELARMRYQPKPKKGSTVRSPDEQWIHRALISARHRAKRKGMAFSIAKEEITIPTHCPILGIVLEVNSGNATRKNGNSPSLDRIDNTKGYVSGNVRVISARANHLKSDATFAELDAIYRDALSHQPTTKGYAHINQHHIRANAKDGGNRPVITVKLGNTVRYAREASFNGEVRLKYDGSSLSCGARCWLEFDGPITLTDEMSHTEARTAA